MSEELVEKVALALAAEFDAHNNSPTKAVTAYKAGVGMTIDYWNDMARAAIALLPLTSDAQGEGASSVPEDRAVVPSGPSQQAVSAVPASIPSADLIRFSHRHKIMDACFDPGAFVGPRLKTDGGYEHMDHWRARAAIEAMLQLACESRSFAQAIEARRAETRSGSVHESAVGNADAPISTPDTPNG